MIDAAAKITSDVFLPHPTDHVENLEGTDQLLEARFYARHESMVGFHQQL